MKLFKRNAVIVTVLLFVAVAVYLNWSYNRGQNLEEDSQVVADNQFFGQNQEETPAPVPSPANGEEESQDAETGFFTPPSSLSASALSYFDSARLTREQARDSAAGLLQDAAAIGTASQGEIDNALGAITAMATFALQEAQIENLLMARDFEQVVVFIRNEGVSVIVSAPPEGLSDVSVARITDAVTGELGIAAQDLTIIPVS